MAKLFAFLLAHIFLCSSFVGASAQQSTLPVSRAVNPRAVNATSIGVISGGADGTYIRIAADLANVLDSDQLRILPIIGRGSLQNLRDLMFLRGVDVGIVQMDAREGLRVDSLYENATQKLRYIARLYNEEVHVLARKGIVDVRELDGKRVNIDKAGSGTNLTARVIFDRLGIKPEFTAFDQSSSYERLRTGEIDAALYVAGRPVRAIAEFSGQADFHLLAIPFESELAQTYFPARFTSEDYPRLVEAGRTVETIAVGNLLVVFNWPSGSERYHRLTRFVDGFFSQFDGLLQPGRHPKWREVNLSATVPNWQRFRPAEEWLQRQERQSAETASDFGRFLETTSHGASPSALDRERLFEQFLSWQRARTSNVKGTNNRLDGRRQ